jgi:hypothetical protein
VQGTERVRVSVSVRASGWERVPVPEFRAQVQVPASDQVRALVQGWALVRVLEPEPEMVQARGLALAQVQVWAMVPELESGLVRAKGWAREPVPALGWGPEPGEGWCKCDRGSAFSST